MRIAREIHDDLGGNLTAIKMALAMLMRALPQESAALTEKVAYIDTLVDRGIDAMHRISQELRPHMLERGIIPALEWQSAEFEKQTGIPCRFSSSERDLDLALDQATALFRIFQEALTNVAKHAKASRVLVHLSRDRHGVTLTINDDGCGINAADRLKTESFGIRGMSARAAALGGSLCIKHNDGLEADTNKTSDAVGKGKESGSALTITIPLAALQ